MIGFPSGSSFSRKMSTTKNPAEWVTAAQIAFVLLTIENYEEITDEVVNGDGKLKGKKGKFTMKGDRKKCGYSILGIQKHGEITERLREWWDREKAAVKSENNSFGKEYLAKKKREDEEMSSGGRTRVLGSNDGDGQQESRTVSNLYSYLGNADVLPDMMEI